MSDSIARDGLTLAYEASGAGDPPLVFVHGWACDRSYFYPQYRYFAPSHRVVTVDLRGHGASSRAPVGAGVYDVETMADDVLAIARSEGLDRPIVIGHSLGALVALECATRGGTVRGAVLIDPAPIINAGIKRFFADSFSDVDKDDDGSWRRNFASNWFMATDTARREEIIRDVAAFPSDIAAASLMAIADFDGATALRRVQVPLVSIGSAVPTDAPADLREACPSIAIGQTVGSGHFNHLEVPEQVNLMIERWLKINDFN